jgi:lysophospholipase L1-like esterase
VERYARYVALGDSQTEGLNDVDEQGRVLGWADRFAAHVAHESPDLHYANLAVRTCRAWHVRQIQLPAALALSPDLATVAVGMNDVLRHDYDLETTVGHVEETFAALVASGARVLSMTFPDVGRMLPVMGWLGPRQRLLNGRLREAAARHGVEVLDLAGLELNGDPRMWSHDRIHGSTEGHTRIAAAMAELMGLPGSDGSWRHLPARPGGWLTGTPLDVVRRDAHWLATFLVPFLVRQARGRPGAEDRAPKRPLLEPVVARARAGDARP